VPPVPAATATTSRKARGTLPRLRRPTRHGFEWFRTTANFLVAVLAYCRGFSRADDLLGSR